jgi:MFS family permease
VAGRPEPLPPPLPPEQRTVGQLVAEAIRLYQRRFWPSLALGLGPAATGIAIAALPQWMRWAFALTGGALLLTASYIGAVVIASELRPDRRTILVALAAGLIAFVPVPFLAYLLFLPAFAWLALVGLVVPVVLIERRGLRAAFARALRLARADYVHALASLATLAIVSLLTSSVLFFLLRGQAAAALEVAAFLALLVISPLLFLGAALLYYDQAARVNAGQPRALPRGNPGL